METFHLKTARGAKEFYAVLTKFMGAAWGKQKLDKEDMMAAATRGRALLSQAELWAYANAKLPGARIRVLHLTPNEGKKDPTVEISVIRTE